MNLGVAFVLFALFLIVYWAMIEIFALLFRISGLPKDQALFQAISLLTACGFTTKESEEIIGNQNRRHIATAAMVIGYIFTAIIISLFFNLMSTMSSAQTQDSIIIIIVTLVCLVLLFIIYHIPAVKKNAENIIDHLARAAYSRRENENIINMIEEYGNYAICEVFINHLSEDMTDKAIFEMGLKEKYGLNIMSITRKNRVIVITKDTHFQPKDTILVYGPYKGITGAFSFYEHKALDNLDHLQEEETENLISLVDNYGKDAMVTISVNKVPDRLFGKTLFTSNLKVLYSLNIIAIKRDGAPVPVGKDTIIKKGDEVLIYGDYANIKKIFVNNE